MIISFQILLLPSTIFNLNVICESINVWVEQMLKMNSTSSKIYLLFWMPCIIANVIKKLRTTIKFIIAWLSSIGRVLRVQWDYIGYQSFVQLAKASEIMSMYMSMQTKITRNKRRSIEEVEKEIKEEEQ
jgi:hypothetical protein